AGPEARTNWFEKRAGREDLRVAVHAGLRRGNPCEGRPFDRRMAVAAVDTVAGDVPFVAELNRLVANDVRFSDPRRSVDGVEEAEQRHHSENRAENRDLGNSVGAAVEDLRHRSGDPRIAKPMCCKSEAEVMVEIDGPEGPYYLSSAGTIGEPCRLAVRDRGDRRAHLHLDVALDRRL